MSERLSNIETSNKAATKKPDFLFIKKIPQIAALVNKIVPKGKISRR